MHILVMVHDFSPGGAERICLRLAAQWARQGHRITVACGTAVGPLRKFIRPEMALVEFGIKRASGSRIALGNRLARSCLTLKPDIIFLPGNYYFDAAVAIKARMRARSPLLIGKLSNTIIRPGKNRVQQYAYNLAIRVKSRFLNHIVAMSPGLADEARAFIPSHVPMSIVSQPILDSIEEASMDHRSTFPRGRRRFVAAGRLASQKNFRLLIDAVSEMRRREDIIVDIYGDGPLKEQLIAQIGARGLNDVISLRGYVDSLLPQLGDADGFILSSDFEGFPSVVVEAMAAGVPVVATDCSPAMQDILFDHSTNIVIPPRDRGALTAALERLATMPRPDMRKAKAGAGAYTLDASARAYLSLFAGLLQGHGARA